MPVILHHSRDLPRSSAYDHWFSVTGAAGPEDAGRKRPDVARHLEEAFERCHADWWALARALADAPDAELSFAATCAGFGSDMGLMMAWGRLVADAAAESGTTLVVCDDPWLFRHLAGVPGVTAGAAPSLAAAVLQCRVRGLLARLALAFRLGWTTLVLRRQRRNHGTGDPVILVYGHPRSTADGYDDYFGTLMRDIPTIRRALHTDCDARLAKRLGADGRTASLHAWGRVSWAANLPFRRWRPGREHFGGVFGWLVRRAADLEGGGAGHAINLWQQRCQDAWLRQVQPCVVVWPWENFGWERALCRSARRLRIATAGYQHTVFGSQQPNYSLMANADGVDSLPDRILCDGAAYRDKLLAWGMPAERMEIAGSLRIDISQRNLYDPDGPVFVALSGVLSIADQQIEAVRKLAASGHKVVVKDHPMYRIKNAAADGLTLTDRPLVDQEGLSAVIYTTGTSGLEALLAGLPAIRLLSDDRAASSILPDDIEVPAATGDDIVDALAAARKPEIRDWSRVLAPPDLAVWKAVFGAVNPSPGDKYA